MTLDADPASANSPQHPRQVGRTWATGNSVTPVAQALCLCGLKPPSQHIIGPQNQAMRKYVKAQPHQTLKNDILASPLPVSLVRSHTCKNSGGWGVSIHRLLLPSFGQPQAFPLHRQGSQTPQPSPALSALSFAPVQRSTPLFSIPCTRFVQDTGGGNARCTLSRHRCILASQNTHVPPVSRSRANIKWEAS